MRYRIFKQDGMWCAAPMRPWDKPGERRTPVVAARTAEMVMKAVCAPILMSNHLQNYVDNGVKKAAEREEAALRRARAH